MTINFRAYSKQTYYVIFRSDLLSFQNTSFKIFTWFPTDPVLQDISYNLVGFDPYANPLSNLTNSLYAHVNDSNFIQLPTDSNLMGLDPSSDVFNSNIPIPEALIGYDISGVSIDLTDYKGYLQTNPRSNVPLLPILTGVDTSNEGAMGSVIKATVSFTMYPSITESGVVLERIQSAFLGRKRI